MVGQKGKSGGPREGAGRKPQRFSLHLDTQYGVSIEPKNGRFLPTIFGQAVEITRSFVVLEMDNGDRVTIIR